MRESRNCSGEHPEYGETIGFKWAPELRRCPFAVISPDAWRAFGLWSEWKNYGGLPCAGELYDQRAPVVEALKICEAAHLASERKKGGPEGSEDG